MTAIRIAHEDRKPFFTSATLAEYFQCSERTIRQLVKDERIESVRVAGVRRFMAEDVDDFVARNRTRRR